MNKYQLSHKKLIENSGGEVEDVFVLKTGVIITKTSNITQEAQELFKSLNIDFDLNDKKTETKAHAEFNSRLTYLSFLDNASNNNNYINKMINEFQHLSIFNDEYVTFLIAGCSVETELEFIAHNEAKVARLTSSKTKAQNEPLYKIIDSISIDRETQKSFIKDFIKLKESYKEQFKTNDNSINNEVFNLFTTGNKAVSFTITMSIKDWHKTLIGRLSEHGVEYEMLQICEEIALQLNNIYPYFFKTISEYYLMNNGKKYE
jgi:thymidylate synthase ThyX